MPSKKRNNKRAKMEKRRTRHNQNRKEDTNMTGNIGEITDITVTETAETTTEGVAEATGVTVETATGEVAEAAGVTAETATGEVAEAAGVTAKTEAEEITEVTGITGSVKTAVSETEGTVKTEAEDKINGALETECPVSREDNEVENKKQEDVTVKKETSHKLYIQYNDLEFSDELMFEAAVNAYCNEYGKDKSSVEAVNLYVKPQEGKAYYVINNDAEKTGSIDL